MFFLKDTDKEQLDGKLSCLTYDDAKEKSQSFESYIYDKRTSVYNTPDVQAGYGANDIESLADLQKNVQNQINILIEYKTLIETELEKARKNEHKVY